MATRIFIVDDDRDAADSLAMLVGIQGHEVRVAYNGPTALNTMDGFRPHAVVLDLAMPGMDGYEVARRTRQLPGMERVRLICLSGYGREQDRQRAREAGFDHFLVKPVAPTEVFALLAAAAPPCPQPMPGAERSTTALEEMHRLLGRVRGVLGIVPAPQFSPAAPQPSPPPVNRLGPPGQGLTQTLTRAGTLIRHARQVCAAAKESIRESSAARHAAVQARHERAQLALGQAHPVSVARYRWN